MFERKTNQSGRDSAHMDQPQANGRGAMPDGATHSPFDPATTMGSSVIGTDLTILGEGITIISKNNLRIDGDIRGNVVGKEVVIGPEGSVIGTVSAETVEIFGGVRGSICSAAVSLHDSAQVDGEIAHARLNVATGAYFEGSVRRLSDRNELEAKLDPRTYGAAGK